MFYFKYKSVDEITNKLNEYINEATAKREAWAAVAVLKRKNGEEYERIGQAVKGARFGGYYPVEDKEHPYLTVTAQKSGRYYTDSLQAFFYVDELPADDPRRQNYVRSFLRQTTPATPDELRRMIAERVEALTKTIKEYNDQIAAAPKAFEHFREAIEEADRKLKSEALADKSIYFSSLYYLITEKY